MVNTSIRKTAISSGFEMIKNGVVDTKISLIFSNDES